MCTWIVRNAAAGVAALSLIAAGDLASAQLFRRVYPPQPAVQPVQPASPGQAQPIQAQPAQVPQTPGTAAVAAGPQPAQLPPLDPAKTVRGSQLVGQTILDPSSQRVGVVKDFLVDSETARVVFLLMAPEGSQANADWIVIPFDDLRLSADANSQPIFVLNLQAAHLRRAPYAKQCLGDVARPAVH